MKNERLLLFLLAAAMFTHIMDFMIMMPLGPQLKRIFNITPQEFGFLVASYTITAGVSGFIAAFFIDRYDRKKALVFIYSGFALGTLACAFSNTFFILLFTRSLAGAFGGVLGALILSIVSDAIPLERRAKSIGLVMASFGVASVVGVPFGLFLATSISWHIPFLILGLMAMAIAGLIILFMKPMTAHIRTDGPMKKSSILKAIFLNPNAQLGLTFSALLMLGHFTIIPFIAQYLVGNVGFSEQELAYVYLVGGICTLIFSPIVGRLADQYGRLKIFTIFGLLVLIPIVLITNMPPVPLWAALIVAAVFFIFSNGRMVPSTTMETAVISPEIRGSYISIRSSVQQFASGIASFVAGMILTERASEFSKESQALVNYGWVGAIAVFFSLIGLLVARKLTVVSTK